MKRLITILVLLTTPPAYGGLLPSLFHQNRIALYSANTDTVPISGNASFGPQFAAPADGVACPGGLGEHQPNISVRGYYANAGNLKVCGIGFFFASPAAHKIAKIRVGVERLGSSGLSNLTEISCMLQPVTLTANAVNTITFSHPLDSGQGDFISISFMDFNGACVPLTPYVTDGERVEHKSYSSCYDGTTHLESGFGAIQLIQYGQAPVFVHIGDSLTAAQMANANDGSLYGFTSENVATLKTYDAAVTPAYQVAHHFSCTYLQLGKSGEKAYELLARFDADVIRRKPKYVIISTGTNDIINRNCGNLISNIATMLDAAVAACIVPVVTSINPVHGYWATFADTMYAKNAELENLVARFPTALWVDTQPILGDRALHEISGLPVYLMKAAYNSGDSLHYNAAGYIAWGKHIAEVLHCRFLRDTSLHPALMRGLM